MPPLSPLLRNCLAIAVAQTFSMQTAQAATITVDSLTDNGTGCTLRDAINNTNAGADQSNGCTIAGTLGTNDIIDFNSGLSDGTINLLSGGLGITNDLVINGFNITLDANQASRVMTISASSTVSLNQLTLANGSAATGGGIFVDSSNVNLSNSTLSGNSATNGGSGIFANSSSVSLNNSTLLDNSTPSTGGGIFAYSSSSISLSNSTLSGNSANGGGGIYASSSSVILSNSTLSGNSAANSGGGIFAVSSSSISLSNTIVSGNSASSAVEITSNASTITANKNNLFGHSGLTDAQAFNGFAPSVSDINASSDGINVNLSNILEPLADNGGNTLTHALAVGSPAIDAGDDAVCAAAPINNLDQRAVIRPAGVHCDIGSFEVEVQNTINVSAIEGVGCSLQDAITSANTDTATGSCVAGNGNDLIDIPNQTITLTAALPAAEQYGGTGLPTISSGITINGNGSTIVRDSAEEFRFFALEASNVSASLALSNITLTNGHSDFGGAVYASIDTSLVLDVVSIRGNIANNYGGGVYDNYSATLTISNSTISNNTAANVGGGVSSRGGGDLVIKETLISNNTAVGTKGGGVFLYRKDAVLVNSTVSGNEALSRGSAIYINASSVGILNSTLSGNKVIESLYMAGNATYPATATLNNSVVANTSGASDCAFGATFTTFASSTSWFEDNSCDGVADGDPKLNSLADNGGPTKTHAPMPGSGLIDAGNVAICTDAPVSGVDQRGEARGISSCFIGAVEEVVEVIEQSSFFVVPLANGKAVIFSL